MNDTNKRWIVTAYKNVFVLKPNPLHSKTTETSNLVIFRQADTIIETQADVELPKHYGPYQITFYIDAFIGILNIDIIRFLVVAVESEYCGTLPQAHTVKKHQPNEIFVPAIEGKVYFIKRACLIPFNVSLHKCVILDERHINWSENMNSIINEPILPVPPNKLKTSSRSSNDDDKKDDTGNWLVRQISNLQKSYISRGTGFINSVIENQEQTARIDENVEYSTNKSESDDDNYETDDINLNLYNTIPQSNSNEKINELPNITHIIGANSLMQRYLGDKLAAYKVAVEKLLANGFYYSYEVDLSQSLQKKILLGFKDGPQGEPCTLEEDNCGFMDVADPCYVWNWQITMPLRNWKVDSRWLVPLIQGSVATVSIDSPCSVSSFTLVCRRSPNRSGTRYNARGIDDLGNVANFCESEFLINLVKRSSGVGENKCYGYASLVQIRGSIPVYWEQTGIGVKPKLYITRTIEEVCTAFRLHQQIMSNQYGDLIYINLLSDTKGGERKLLKALSKQITHYQNTEKERKSESEEGKSRNTFHLIRHIPWDFHEHVKAKGFENALEQFVNSLVGDAYRTGYYCQEPLYSETQLYQTGVLRSNCLDCLDRTNAFQWYYAWKWCSQYLLDRGVTQVFMPGLKLQDNFEVPYFLLGQIDMKNLLRVFYITPNGQKTKISYKILSAQQKRLLDVSQSVSRNDVTSCILKDVIAQMWAEHGDNISVQYSGTRSVFSALVKQAGKPSFATNLDHVLKSLGRFYHNNFEDSFRQEAIDLCLATHVLSRKSTVVAVPTILPPEEVSQTPDIDDVIIKEKDDIDPLGSGRHVVAVGKRAPLKTKVSLEYKISDSCSENYIDDISSNKSHSSVNIINDLVFWAGTWNVGGGPVYESFEAWLKPTRRQLQIDIYCICLQEIVELSGMRLLLNQSSADREWQIDQNITSILGHRYRKLRSLSLVGLYSVIYVKSPLDRLIKVVRMTDFKLGFKGIANKGGIAMRFTLYGTSFCIINVHLAAGKDKLIERRNQFENILLQGFQNYPGRTVIPILEHDVVFCCGDFNFRLDCDQEKTDSLINMRRFFELLAHDQLRKEVNFNVEPFCNWKEPEINFWPTYKYKKGTSTYDKSRVQAWCDRVLFQGKYINEQPHRVDCVLYCKVDALKSSDHKPVYAVYKVTCDENRRCGNNDEIESSSASEFQSDVLPNLNRSVYEKAENMDDFEGIVDRFLLLERSRSEKFEEKPMLLEDFFVEDKIN